MIDFQDVSLVLSGNPILSEVSLNLEAQKIHILLGPSGSGKSTLLKAVLGIHRPTKGQILLGHIPLARENQRQMAMKMGHTVQDGGLFPHLTAEENVLLVSKLRRYDPDRAQDRLEQLRKLVHIKEKTLKLYPRHLSGGEKQRVALMRALFCDPDILLMDEPLGALDPIGRGLLKEELHRIFKALKKTVIFVTHDIFEASYLSENVVLISKGRIVQTGPFQDLITAPKSPFVSEFLESQRRATHTAHF